MWVPPFLIENIIENLAKEYPHARMIILLQDGLEDIVKKWYFAPTLKGRSSITVMTESLPCVNLSYPMVYFWVPSEFRSKVLLILGHPLKAFSL